MKCLQALKQIYNKTSSYLLTKCFSVVNGNNSIVRTLIPSVLHQLHLKFFVLILPYSWGGFKFCLSNSSGGRNLIDSIRWSRGHFILSVPSFHVSRMDGNGYKRFFTKNLKRKIFENWKLTTMKLLLLSINTSQRFPSRLRNPEKESWWLPPLVLFVTKSVTVAPLVFFHGSNKVYWASSGQLGSFNRLIIINHNHTSPERLFWVKTRLYFMHYRMVIGPGGTYPPSQTHKPRWLFTTDLHKEQCVTL